MVKVYDLYYYIFLRRIKYGGVDEPDGETIIIGNEFFDFIVGVGDVLAVPQETVFNVFKA